MAYTEILLEVADGVAVVTLNRPERLNAYTPTMGTELSDAFATCDADDALRGVVPEALSTWTVPRLIGMARAADVLLTGRMIPAREALELGLVSRVVPDADLLQTARAL